LVSDILSLLTFTWCEDAMPTLGAVVINLGEKGSNGKTFGLNIVSEKKGRENETS